MKSLTTLLQIRQGESVGLVGSGGKTSLLLQLGTEWRQHRVLLSTTTKIGKSEITGADYLYTNAAQWEATSPLPGIHIAGIPQGGKLHPLPADALNALRRQFDLTVLECDGSRRLPLKGWREDEPVLPAWLDLTIGVMAVQPLGLPLRDDIVFQPKHFASISGCRLGAALTPAHLAAAICHPQGLFHHAAGRRALFLRVCNQTELAAARQICRLLPQTCTKNTYAVLAGNVHQGLYYDLTRG